MPPAEPPAEAGVSEEPFLINVAGEVFTKDYAEFGREVGRKLVADGGGDTPESALDGLVLAARQTFRKGATRVLILITDAPPKIPDMETESVDEAAGILRDNKIDQLHLVINNPYRDIYTPLQKDSPGSIFNLQDAVRGTDKFDSLLPTVSREIARITTASQPAVLEKTAATRPPTPVPPPAARAQDLPPIPPPAVLGGVQSQEKFAVESSGRLLLAIAVWTAMITAMIAMALCAGQHRYLKEGLLPSGAAARSWLGGSLAGLAGGAAGQLLYLAAPGALGQRSDFSHSRLDASRSPRRNRAILLRAQSSDLPAASWAARSAARPELSAYLGVASPSAACRPPTLRVAFWARRLLGSALGLTLALAERIARKAWLEICYGGGEIRTVNLGPQAVSIGSDMRAATVYARGLPPVAYRYSFEAGKVTRQDAATNELTELRPDEPQSIGAVTVTLRTADSATVRATGPSAAAQPSPPARPAGVPARPVSASAAKPAAAVRQPAVPSVSAHSMPAAAAPVRTAPSPIPAGATPSPAVAALAPRPASAVAPSAATSPKAAAAPRDPGACPSCGRPVPGVPGRRYCIHCDLYL